MLKKHLTKFNIHFIIKQKLLIKIGVEGNILNLIMNTYKIQLTGISLEVQGLRLGAPDTGGLGLVPGQETRSHALRLRVHRLQRRSKIPRAPTKNDLAQTNK